MDRPSDEQVPAEKRVMIVGIDLGTTNSAVAYMTANGPRLVPNALGEVLTPSVVGIDLEGCLLVGRAARELEVTHPDRCASVFKRQMGTDWTARLVEQTFTPEQLSGLVLQALKQDVAAHLGYPVDRAVITVPAYFNEHQRRATINAGKIAGLEVERIVNEPTAAAIAYGSHESQQDRILAVCDLGGGTFDVSIVEIFEGIVEVRASSGDSLLGGEDFTAALASRVASSYGLVYERAEIRTPLLTQRLRQQCELAKCQLSSKLEARIRFPDEQGQLPEHGEEVLVTRTQFQSWTEHVLDRLDQPLRRAISDASLRPGDLHEVLLVGGATRMPAVLERLAEKFGKEPRRTLNPDEVVALGAGVQAGLIARHEALEDLVVTDVAPFTLGTAVAKRLAGVVHSGYFHPIIHRNTPIPVSRVHTVGTVESNQTGVLVRVYQGENRRVDKNVLLGEFAVEGIPEGPPGQAIDLRFTYDLNGILEVEATIVETQKTFSQVFTQHAKGMSAQEVAEAVKAMAALKQHPREDAWNRLLLHRAERLYAELSLRMQKALSELLDGFEEAMELGARPTIDRFRKEVEAFLDRHDAEGKDDSNGDSK